MLKIAKAALLLLVFSLPFTKHGMVIGGLQATATDFFCLVAVVALAAAFTLGKVRLRWSNGFALLGAYFAAMLASVLVVGTVVGTTLKLISQLYLLSLPVLGYPLIDDRGELRRVFRMWLAGTAISAGISVFTVILFTAGIDPAKIGYALHGFGTLPPGSYPRLE